MIQELLELGFKNKGNFYELWLNDFEYSIVVTITKYVSISQDKDFICLFKYDYKRLTRLIKVLK